MIRGVAMVIALGACNQLLDLDSPEVVADVVDGDLDGITDSRDNCPSEPNPDQEDSDGDRRGDACDDCPFARPTRDRDSDGLDDACDSCVLGPQVDDDGDGAMDACDICPATPSQLQLDSDGDLIGDNCDEAVGLRDNERVLFDPFTRIDPSWAGGPDFQLAPDATSLIAMAAGLSTLSRTEPGTATASAMFELVPTGTVGVALADTLLRCELRCTAGQCVLYTEEAGQQASSLPAALQRVTVKAAVRSGSMKLATMFCSAFRDDGTEIFISLETAGFRGERISVFASPGNKVLGADLVR